jgi:ATP-binding cassette subfamily B protein
MVGASGSGKSTVLALLTRLFEPRSGTILFDGIPLSHATDASLRDIMTVVPQSSTLFQGTIRDNIVIGRPAATDGDVARAAAAAALEDLAAMLPGGLDAPVGEGGSLLSGGQRQRVAIARALLREAPILLLDEATSAVDAGSEETINRTLTDHSGRTVIAITHRLAAAAGFDRVLVFDKGRLVQDGPHARLAAEPGLYNALWAKIAGLSAPSADAVPAAWLRNIPFFAGCRPEILQALATAFLSEEIPEGREVFRQGDPGARFYILARGTVDVMIQTPGQEPRRAAVLRDGDFFGEIALVTDHPRNATIRTVTDCWFLTLHRTAFLTLLNEEPELRSRVMAAMARRSEASGASAPANAAAARP